MTESTEIHSTSKTIIVEDGGAGGADADVVGDLQVSWADTAGAAVADDVGRGACGADSVLLAHDAVGDVAGVADVVEERGLGWADAAVVGSVGDKGGWADAQTSRAGNDEGGVARSAGRNCLALLAVGKSARHALIVVLDLALTADAIASLLGVGGGALAGSAGGDEGRGAGRADSVGLAQGAELQVAVVAMVVEEGGLGWAGAGT